MRTGGQFLTLVCCFLTVVGVQWRSAVANAQDELVTDVPDQTPQLVVDADGFTAVEITHLTISSDGRYLAAAAGKIVRVWDLKSQKLWTTLRGYQERQGYHIGYIDSMSFSPDGRMLTVGVSDNSQFGSTREYDMANRDKLHRLIPGQGGCSRRVEYSPDGKFLGTFG